MHSRIISVMKALGYKSNENGVCTGIVQAWISSCLSGTENEFNDLVKFITDDKFFEYVKKYNEKLNIVKDKVSSIAEKTTQLKKQMTELKKEYKVDEIQINKIEDQLKELSVQRNNQWKEWEKSLRLAKNIRKASELFEQIELYFQPHEYESFFGKDLDLHQADVEIISRLAASKELEAKGGLIEIYSYPVIGSKDQIDEYFRNLEKKLSEMKIIVPMALGSDNHKIGVRFDTIDEKWTITDPNDLPPKIISRSEISDSVMKAFGDTNVSLFNVEIYSTHDRAAKQNLKPQLDDFRNSHVISQEMADQKNDRDVPLAWLVYRNNHPDLIAKLADRQFNFNETMTVKGAKVNFVSRAVSENNIPMVEALGKAGINLDFGDDSFQNRNPLYQAVSQKNNLMVQTLIKYGADVNGESKPIMVAVENGDTEMVRLLASLGASLNQPDKSNTTPLQIAIRKNNKDIVTTLVSLGANVDYKDENGNTLAHIAVEKGWHDIIPILANKGFDLNQANNKGDFPIHIAAKQNKDLTLSELIHSNANPNILNSKGQTLAHIAVENNADKIIPLLSKHNFDLNQKEKTPPEVVEKLKQSHEKFCAKYGLTLDKNAIYGSETPMESAIYSSNEATIVVLAKHLNPSVIQNFSSGGGQTLEEIAKERGWDKLAEELGLMKNNQHISNQTFESKVDVEFQSAPGHQPTKLSELIEPDGKNETNPTNQSTRTSVETSTISKHSENKHEETSEIAVKQPHKHFRERVGSFKIPEATLLTNIAKEVTTGEWRVASPANSQPLATLINSHNEEINICRDKLTTNVSDNEASMRSTFTMMLKLFENQFPTKTPEITTGPNSLGLWESVCNELKITPGFKFTEPKFHPKSNEEIGPKPHSEPKDETGVTFDSDPEQHEANHQSPSMRK